MTDTRGQAKEKRELAARARRWAKDLPLRADKDQLERVAEELEREAAELERQAAPVTQMQQQSAGSPPVDPGSRTKI